jgi:nitrilase
MKIAVIQMNSLSDKAANLAEATRLIERAVGEEGPDWVILPEHFDWAGGTSADKLANADGPEGGPARDFAQSMAVRHGIWLHAGSFMSRVPGENRIHNRTVVFDRVGRQVATYDKIHLFDITAPDGQAYRESATVKPGDAVITYDCEGVTVGCSICYDIRFPELFQELRRQGAELIALPAAFTLQTGKDHWEVLARARAIETQTWFVASAQTGSFLHGAERRFTYGHSLVVDPWGHVVARASDGPGYVTARIDRDLTRRVRGMIPVFEHKVLGEAPRKPGQAA